MPDNTELTTNEKLVIRAIQDHEDLHGKLPGKKWIAERCSIHINTVHNVFRSLREKGYMRERNVTVVRLTLSAKAKRVAP